MIGDRRTARGGTPSTVRVAVLNQPVSRAASRTQVRRSRLRTANLVRGIAEQLPGLGLLVLPEFGTHGPAVQPSGRAFTEPDDDLALLVDAARRAGTWLVAPIGGGGVRRPDHRCALFDPDGHVVARYSTGPARSGGPRVVDGPGGLATALTFVDSPGAALADPGVRGAELVIALWNAPGRSPAAVRDPVRALAWSHTCFVAASVACGSVGGHRWSGWSLVAGFGGEVLAGCEDLECELAVADLDPDALRRTRQESVRRAVEVRDGLRRHRIPNRTPNTAPTC